MKTFEHEVVDPQSLLERQIENRLVGAPDPSQRVLDMPKDVEKHPGAVPYWKAVSERESRVDTAFDPSVIPTAEVGEKGVLLLPAVNGSGPRQMTRLTAARIAQQHRDKTGVRLKVPTAEASTEKSSNQPTLELVSAPAKRQKVAGFLSKLVGRNRSKSRVHKTVNVSN